MTAAGERLTALVPCRTDPQVVDVVQRTLSHVDDVLVVGDNAPPAARERLDALVGARTDVLHRFGLPAKGGALLSGVDALLQRARPPELIAVIDADGQHPPEAIPNFVDAARHADVVVGDRTADRSAMPLVRRLGNDAISQLLTMLTQQPMPDTQCGMRLFRASALRAVPLPGGGFEAETEHLVRAAAAGLRIAWVPVPAIYGDEVSDFRTVRDSVRILRAAVCGHRAGSRRRVPVVPRPVVPQSHVPPPDLVARRRKRERECRRDEETLGRI